MISPYRPRSLFLLPILLGLFNSPLGAASPRPVEHANPAFVIEELARGLGVPWGMTFLSPQVLLFSERAGGLRLLHLHDLTVIDLRGAPRVVAEGQGGMLDVAAAPDYASSGWIYFTYSKPTEFEAATTLARARLRDDRLIDWQDLLVSRSTTSSRQHFGSRIAFDDKGHVFFGVGDRGNRDLAQNLGNHIGKIIRLRLDGSVPQDNPYVDTPSSRPEIWSYGHRNPQGLWYDPPSQRLWSNEHGPRGGDEINLILPGRNYGWPVVSHGKEYWGPVSIGEGTSKPGLEDPRKVYIPSIAPGSLMLYRGDAFPEWRGSLFSGALKLQHLNRVSLSTSGQATGEERLLEDLRERIRALAEGPEGWIYLSTDSGRILRLRPAP